MGCFAPDPPPAPNYGQVTKDTLQAQVQEAPAQYAAEAQFSPQYAQLGVSNLGTVLNGTATTPGLNTLMAQSNTNQRASDIADVANLGPQATQAELNANPANAQLLAGLNQQALAGLAAGSSLTPDQIRAQQQAARAAWSARGMDGSNVAVGDEMMRQFGVGQQLLQQRQGFAQSVINSNNAVVGDPFQAILGRSSGASGQAQGILGQSGPSLFNPQAGLNLASSNYATASQYAAANNPLAMIGGLMGGVGKAATGLTGLF